MTATGGVPGVVKVKVVVLIVAGFIAVLKVAVTPVAQMPVAPLNGASEMIVGATKSGLTPGLHYSIPW